MYIQLLGQSLKGHWYNEELEEDHHEALELHKSLSLLDASAHMVSI